jgi:acyl carrier protein
VDRGQLAGLKPDPEAAAGPLLSPPDGSTPNRLRNIVASVLARDSIGLEDNFFDLGASSLDLIRIHAKLVEAFGPGLTAVDLFGHPNIKTLSAKIDGDGATTFISIAERARKRSVALRRAQLTAGRTGTA